MSLTDQTPNAAVIRDLTRNASIPSLNGSRCGAAITIHPLASYFEFHNADRHDDASPPAVGSSRRSAGEVGAPIASVAPFPGVTERPSWTACNHGSAITSDTYTASVRNPVLPHAIGSSRNATLHAPVTFQVCDTAKSARIDHALAAEGERLVAAIIAQHRRPRT